MANTKIALVTGGSRGIGKNTALKLAEKGLDVVITYQHKQAQALDVVKAIQQLGKKATAIALDVSKSGEFPEFVKRLTEYLVQVYGQPNFDYLVNNAGTGGHIPFENATESDFDEMVNIHYKAVYFLTQTLLPYLNNEGGIVNISSGLARFSQPNTSLYASAKGAVEVLSRILAVELANRKIRVNTVAPGAIQTDFNGGLVRDNEQVNKRIAGITTLGRPGLPEDIGGVIAFLCTNDAGWITGQRIEVSGGMFL